MNTAKGFNVGDHRKRLGGLEGGKPTVRLRFLLAAVLALVAASLTGAKGESEYSPLSYKEWKESVETMEKAAVNPRTSEGNREFYKVVLHLIREGRRLGYVDGLAECAAEEMGDRP